MKRILLFLSILLPTVMQAQDKMKGFVDELMAKMTIEEKIGQLNLLPAGDIETGGAMDSPSRQSCVSGTAAPCR